MLSKSVGGLNMAIALSLYDWSCAELIHTYVDLHYDDFCEVMNVDLHYDDFCEVMIDGPDISELKYTENNFSDFKDWASAMGYTVTR